MGQTQSAEAAVADEPEPRNNSDVNSNRNSMESLIAEAVAYGSDETESLEAKAQKALECPCIADLRSGPCGDQFSEAFLCFLKSTSEEKGSDCVHPFVALQNCIKVNPNAFSKDILDEDEGKEKEQVQEYKIQAPSWSKESQRPKSKL
ncbi:mitochondrial intermembrane space import and assembly protein 40 [Quillaja saponaria]|uniref:Mitochondrial intermembrane space import and assembly protein 40 homolog n=1 Tax=Quillaja saponaria TaxID=32244 RepID=A0AAD7PGE4_QUISA|nr:mitochondrial intermembrane space import and assembly protein 40 [Quillaja saponaria]